MIEQDTEATTLINALAGEGNIVVLSSTFRQARQTRTNLRASFPRATMHAGSWNQLEHLQGLHPTELVFLVTEELPPDIMAQIEPYQGRIIYL